MRGQRGQGRRAAWWTELLRSTGRPAAASLLAAAYACCPQLDGITSGCLRASSTPQCVAFCLLFAQSPGVSYRWPAPLWLPHAGAREPRQRPRRSSTPLRLESGCQTWWQVLVLAGPVPLSRTSTTAGPWTLPLLHDVLALLRAGPTAGPPARSIMLLPRCRRASCAIWAACWLPAPASCQRRRVELHPPTLAVTRARCQAPAPLPACCGTRLRNSRELAMDTSETSLGSILQGRRARQAAVGGKRQGARLGRCRPCRCPPMAAHECAGAAVAALLPCHSPDWRGEKDRARKGPAAGQAGQGQQLKEETGLTTR